MTSFDYTTKIEACDGVGCSALLFPLLPVDSCPVGVRLESLYNEFRQFVLQILILETIIMIGTAVP